MNKVILTGRLAADPESRTTANGVATCTFRLAVQRRFANAQGVREADFLPVIAWKQLAEICTKYLAKGRMVAVEGSIQTRSYDAQDGSKRYVTEIVADNVEFLGSKDDGAQGTVNATVSKAQQTLGEGFTEVDDDALPF